MQQVDGLKATKQQQELDEKFCCNTKNGIGCYVFGKASCGNCIKFCSGDMVIKPVTR